MQKLFVFTMIALLALVSCRKQPVANELAPLNEELQGLRSIISRTAQPAFSNTLQWEKATSLKLGNVQAGYAVPCAGSSKRLIARKINGSWQCLVQEVITEKATGSFFSGTVTTSEVDGSAAYTAKVENNKTVQHIKYKNNQMVYDSKNPGNILPDITRIVWPPNTIFVDGVRYLLLMGGSAGWGSGGSNEQEATTYLETDIGGGGVSGGQLIQIDYNYLINTLGVSQLEFDWLVSQPVEAAQLYHYLLHENMVEKADIAKQHMQQLINDTAYLNFSRQHNSGGAAETVWWKDTTWLYNPDNFSLGVPNAEDSLWKKFKALTAEEKILAALYPSQAYTIYKNQKPAMNMTESRMGSGTNAGVNDMKDAFRHCYFQALNTATVEPHVSSVFGTTPGYKIVQAFADAHESEVPPKLLLEKQMDLFNNEAGINLIRNTPTPRIFSIDDMVIIEMGAGKLRYLDPLDGVLYPPYDKNTPNCTNCTNGIIPGVTKMIPTN